MLLGFVEACGRNEAGCVSRAVPKRITGVVIEIGIVSKLTMDLMMHWPLINALLELRARRPYSAAAKLYAYVEAFRGDKC